MSESEVDEVDAVFRRVASLLGGRKPQVVGAVIADLLARFIAGHVVVGSEEETAKLREHMLEQHMEAVRALIGPNARQIGADLMVAGSKEQH